MIQILITILIILLPSQLAFHFWPTWSFVFGTRIDYLSPTLYLTDLLIFLLIFFHRPKIKIPLAIIIFLTLNIFFSLSPLVTILKWLRILEYFALFKILTTNHLSHHPLLITRPLSIAILWTSLLAWFQFALQSSVGGLWYWAGERTFTVATPGIAKISLLGHELLRTYATFPHPNALAGFLLVAVLIVMLSAKRSIQYKSAIIIALLTIPLTFSRTAIFLELIVLVYCLVPRFKKILLVFVVALSLCYFATLQLSPSFTDRHWLLQKSLIAIQNFPIFGLGLGAFPSFQPQLTIPSFALQFQPVHNIFLLLTSELGLPFSLFILYKLFNFLTKLKTDNWKLVTPISIIFVTSLVDHYWLTLHQNILLMVLLLAITSQRLPTNDQ